MAVHPDCFSHQYGIDREKFIEIIDDFFAAGLIIPDGNNTHYVDWLEITEKAHAFVNSGGFSSSPKKKGKIKIKDFDSIDLCKH